MKLFLSSLRANNGTIIPPAPDFDPNTIVLKLDGWWINGIDQLSTNDLTVSGTQYALPNTTALKDSSALISLNEWYLAEVPVLIEKAQVANYCASRQFYSVTKDELFIIKKGQHLTQDEEDGLINYLSISKSHFYHSNSAALFARFTNIYSLQEKSRIDNVIRLLVSTSIWDKVDHFYLAALSGIEEQLLDWKDDTTDLVPVIGFTERAPYRGLAPQTGSFTTNASIDSSINISSTSAFVSFKTYLDIDVAYHNYLFGTTGYGMKAKPYLVNGGKGYAVNLFKSYPRYFGLGTTDKYSDTVTSNLTNTTGKVFIKDAVRFSDSTQTSDISSSSDIIKIGGDIAEQKQSNPNNLQFLSWGGYLSDLQSIFLNSVIDNFCYGQTTIDTPYVLKDGIKVYQLEHPIFDYNNGMCIWADYKKIYFSKDGGETVFSSVNKPDINSHIQLARIFDNGKVIFAMSTNKIYKTDETMVLTEITPTKNGVPYTIHTPLNANYPGEYYKELQIRTPQYLNDGTEIFVWSNYGNVGSGANPMVVWYSFGDDVKVAFEYGQNPYYGDFITDTTGNAGGVLLGSTTETTRSRHSHGVGQQAGNKNIFYSTGGDYNRAAVSGFDAFYECGWVTLEYNPISDSFSKIDSFDKSWISKWKSTSPQCPGDGYVYFTSDASDLNTYPEEGGVFKCAYADVGDDTKVTRVYQQSITNKPLMASHYDGTEFVGQYSNGGDLVGLFVHPNVIYTRTGFSNMVEHRLKIPGNVVFFKTMSMGNNKFLFIGMPEYSYTCAFSIIIDFN